jgi:hypothetical protein
MGGLSKLLLQYDINFLYLRLYQPLNTPPNKKKGGGGSYGVKVK